jgi:hypothetical protein
MFQSYVVCALGISHVSLALISMGILQAIAGCTLSLLLQHVPRSLVTGNISTNYSKI